MSVKIIIIIIISLKNQSEVTKRKYVHLQWFGHYEARKYTYIHKYIHVE
jgi:hypothetical protein